MANPCTHFKFEFISLMIMYRVNHLCPARVIHEKARPSAMAHLSMASQLLTF
jgi:hypothetical protein